MKPPSTPESRSSAAAPARRPPPPRYGRQILFFVVVVGALIVSIAAVTGDRGWLDVRRQKAQLGKLRAEVGSVQRENAALLAEVRALRSDPYVIERIARERLGYARRGEIIFQFPPADAPVPLTSTR